MYDNTTFADEDDSLIFTKKSYPTVQYKYCTHETYFATFLSVIFGVMLASKAEGYRQ